MTDQYNIIAEQDHSTVVAEYKKVEHHGGHESEDALEKKFIQQLQTMSYEYPKIKTEEELLQNLRKQLESLNNCSLSNSEWKRLLGLIAGENMGIVEKTKIIQKSEILCLPMDNGTNSYIRLIDKKNVHNNKLQVINQYKAPSDSPRGETDNPAKYSNRYDVTILVNGLPLVHVELKRRGVDIKEAFNQINRYQRDSFWSGCGLYEYVQIFVISNGSQTKYYSNTTRFAHVKANEGKIQRKKTDGNSFEFTSWWSDQKNTLLPDLVDFTNTFFSKETLLNILTKYCIFNTDKQLLVMRPYQIAATEKIINRIKTALNMRWMGQERKGGFIWHTTGSGKTLTSFKTAQIASQMDEIAKVMFIVDRKDLDYQTMKEYDNFEKDCANGNSNSAKLLKQLNDPSCKILITTIQKLSCLLKKKADIKVLNENVVMIFDECHRSQFGNMHELIVKRFKKYIMFGFTGTPIFPINAGSSKNVKYRTTADAFGGEPDEKGQPTKALHTYTIVNAINDKNVLPFHIDHESTMKMKDGIDSHQVWGIDTDKALHADERVRIVVDYILTHFAEKTKQNKEWALSKISNVADVVKKNNKVEEKKVKVRAAGFNSIFAVDGVPSAIQYYNEFKKQMQEEGKPKLRIATIYTYQANEEEDEMGWTEEDENPETVGQLPKQSRDALDAAIKDYNETFGMNYSTDGDSFQDYYKDLSLRMKNKEVDILIVVGMFLTGFDAKCLNTLWVDKNLKMHGLLQAYSRTNRILNSVKSCGNIVCFRNLEKATDDALGVFGDPDAGGIIFIKTFLDYYNGYEDDKGKWQVGYKPVAEMLLEKYPVENMLNFMTLDQKKEFIRLFGALMRMRSLLNTFDEFKGREIIDTMTFDDYKSWYSDLYKEFRPTDKGDDEEINDDIVFEMELVRQDSIDITYILRLVNEYHESNCQNKEIIIRMKKDIMASPDMRDKLELIEKFIDRMTPEGGDIYADWDEYVNNLMDEDINNIIAEEKLKDAPAREFIARSMELGYVPSTGTGLTSILPPMPVIGKASAKRKEKIQTVFDRLSAFVSKYLNLYTGDSEYMINSHLHHTTMTYTLPEDEGYAMAAEDVHD